MWLIHGITYFSHSRLPDEVIVILKESIFPSMASTKSDNAAATRQMGTKKCESETQDLPKRN